MLRVRSYTGAAREESSPHECLGRRLADLRAHDHGTRRVSIGLPAPRRKRRPDRQGAVRWIVGKIKRIGPARMRGIADRHSSQIEKRYPVHGCHGTPHQCVVRAYGPTFDAPRPTPGAGCADQWRRAAQAIPQAHPEWEEAALGSAQRIHTLPHRRRSLVAVRHPVGRW